MDHDGDGDPSTTDCDDLDATRFSGNIAERNRCDDIDNDCNPTTLGPDADHDGETDSECCNPQPDGTLACGTDCDDTRPTVNTHAVESCNMVNDDCDAATDEGVVAMLYLDHDGDMYGDENDAPVMGCPDSMPGRVSNGTDCNDSAASIHPGAAELCNGIDDDCDHMTDEPGADGTPLQSSYYPDRDCDGVGDDVSPTLFCPGLMMGLTCPAGSGWVLRDPAVGLDCDDRRADRRPGLAETCDGVDNNCDSLADNLVSSGPNWCTAGTPTRSCLACGTTPPAYAGHDAPASQSCVNCAWGACDTTGTVFDISVEPVWLDVYNGVYLSGGAVYIPATNYSCPNNYTAARLNLRLRAGNYRLNLIPNSSLYNADVWLYASQLLPGATSSTPVIPRTNIAGLTSWTFTVQDCSTVQIGFDIGDHRTGAMCSILSNWIFRTMTVERL